MSKINKGHRSANHSGHRANPGNVQRDSEAVRKFIDQAQDVAVAEDEAVENFIAALSAASTAIAAQALNEIAQKLREDALPILERLAKRGNAALELAAIDALGLTRTEKAVSLLAAVVEQSESKEVQKAARRSLFKLKSVGVAGALAPAKVEPAFPLRRQPGTLLQAYMSSHDGTGHQLLEAISDALFGGVDEVMLLISDTEGIEQFNVGDTTRKAWQRRLEALKKDNPEVGLVEIPVDYFRHKVGQAYELSQALGKAITPRFDRWRDLLVQAEEAAAEHPIYREISLVEIKWNPELLEQSPQIARNVEIKGWLWPGEELKGYVEELRTLKVGKVTLPPWVEAEKSADIIKRTLEHFLDQAGRARFKNRLEDIAYVFFHTERPLDAKRALAAASGFDEQIGVANEKHPFALALLAASIEDFLEGAEGLDAQENRKLITDLSEIAPYISAAHE